MPRINNNEISEHDQLVLMMARYFSRLGYTDIRADIPDWNKTRPIWWDNNPENKYYPDLTCVDTKGIQIILEAETCSTFNDQHTKEQFAIFRAHANNVKGRFEVVVPQRCQNNDARDLITKQAKLWGITLDTVWTPGN